MPIAGFKNRIPMDDKIIHGNADADGKPFRQWFVGNLREWSASLPAGGPPIEETGGRSSSVVEIKWDPLPAGRERPGGWTTPGEKISMSLLVRGRFQLLFRPHLSQPPE